MKKALITGITGQDGSYLAELLCGRGYEVHGVIRRASQFNTDRIDHLYQDPHTPDARLFLHYGDLSDGTVLRRILEAVEPDEVYNLGAQSHVRVSFDEPEYTADVDAVGTLRLLECVRDYVGRSGRPVRFYQAGSSEMFGAAPAPQSEATPFYPRPVRREQGCGALVRRELPRGVRPLRLQRHPLQPRVAAARRDVRHAEDHPGRGPHQAGLQEKLYLGNLDARRDWGFAGDFVEAMWLMLQQDEPGDYVVATGESYSVREFIEAAFGHVGLDWQEHVAFDPRYLRPTEVDVLQGDATRARTLLGWTPKVSFNELVQMMVEHDLELARQELTLRDAGHRVATRGIAAS
jgi:GDPmannose 4,6-dehydratase